MTMNSKLTHYKIRQVSTEKQKRFKTDKLLKWCSSAGRQFHGLTVRYCNVDSVLADNLLTYSFVLLRMLT